MIDEEVMNMNRLNVDVREKLYADKSLCQLFLVPSIDMSLLVCFPAGFILFITSNPYFSSFRDG